MWDIKLLEESLLIGSTLVEGSTLSEIEARAVLQGRTVAGHSIAEHRELLNYRAAVNRLMTQFNASPYLSIDLIKQFHAELFFGDPGAGQFKIEANFTYRSDGTRHQYIRPARVGDALATWIDSFNHHETANIYERAAQLYYEFQNIHPFTDGNGRIGRVLIHYWLYWHHRKTLTFYLKDKVEHLEALEAANQDILEPLVAFFRLRVKDPS